MKLYSIALFFLLLSASGATGQETAVRPTGWQTLELSRSRDSAIAVKLPLLSLPGKYRNRVLPFLVDNTHQECWPGILDQFLFSSCQQYCGVAYVFGYEINRLRHRNGTYWENGYPTHYTWNFMNHGYQGAGVNFLESFEVIRQQGQMTSNDYGIDTATGATGWISGYDKYYRGMFNHLKQVSAIMTNSTTGINTLRNYLFDHLSGSAVGGIACFTTDAAALWNLGTVPAGTPEAGKHIIPVWPDLPDHGLTVVGYNDSVRFDVNNDGKFTNNLDINGDGVVDVRDWEIGAFKLANSYGGYWEDTGYVYCLYRAFAMNYGEGGIWNNRVYTVEADTVYRPMLTAKVNLEYNLRDRIRLLAGVSTDTLNRMPARVIDFPVFSFQGGEFNMQGRNNDPQTDSIEFGLDVTPLLNMVPAGKPARFFLAVEERDPDGKGHGLIRKVSFISYRNGVTEYPAGAGDVNIANNTVTFVSAVLPIEKPDIQITTGSLPPVTPPQPLHVQLAATGGRPPYEWSFTEGYARQPGNETLPQVAGTSLVNSTGVATFAVVALPFSFPFYGKSYDTIYVNYQGFVSFEPAYLPGIYTTNEISMLKQVRAISPSFSQAYVYPANSSRGIFAEKGGSRVVIRWKAQRQYAAAATTDDFALVLYPDGRFEFRYGNMDPSPVYKTCYTGVSMGDDLNADLQTVWDATELSGKSYRFFQCQVPPGLNLSHEGLLAGSPSDSAMISDLCITVADAGKITASKTFQLTGGPGITSAIAGQDDNRMKAGMSMKMKLVLTNPGLQPLQNLVLRLRSADSLLTITDSICSVAMLQPGQPVTLPLAFSFSLKKALANDFPVMTRLEVQSGQRMWKQDAVFRVAAPDLMILKPSVEDGLNNLLDPGEVADLVVPVENSGLMPARNLHLQLSTSDTSVTILSSPSAAIERFEPLSQNDYRFTLKASRCVVPGRVVPMHLVLSDSLGVVQSADCPLPLGMKQLAVVSLSTFDLSMKAMAAALDSLRMGYDTLRAIPADPKLYANIFLILGTSSTGWHTLTQAEAGPFVTFLQNHGHLYMEGYLTWHYSNNTPLHPYFKYTTANIPSYNYEDILGVHGAFTDSMAWHYNNPLNHAVFSFEPVSPAWSTMVNAHSPAKNFEIAYDGPGYKTIGTFLGFSSLEGSGPLSTKTALMKRYLEFFGVNINGPWPFFHPSATAVCLGKTITFTDDSYDHILSRHWEFPGGFPPESSLANPEVRYDTTGRYDVRLTVTGSAGTKSIVKQRYISVGRCSGLGEVVLQPLIRIFPNPASEKVTIELRGGERGKYSIMISDLAGRRVYTKTECIDGPDGSVAISIAGLKKGLYVLQVRSRGTIVSKKLVIG